MLIKHGRLLRALWELIRPALFIIRIVYERFIWLPMHSFCFPAFNASLDDAIHLRYWYNRFPFHAIHKFVISSEKNKNKNIIDYPIEMKYDLFIYLTSWMNKKKKKG